MAFLRRCQTLLVAKKSLLCEHNTLLPSMTLRTVSTSSVLPNEHGWFSKLLVRKIEPGKDAHSRLLSDSEAVYEMQIHDVKPDSVEKYLNLYESYCNEIKQKNIGYELVGSWQVEIGDQDQMIHVWRHVQGWPQASRVIGEMKKDTTICKLTKDQGQLLRSRDSQFMLAFSFWGHPAPNTNNHFFEMRSYVLKPGTMIEWANNWARAVTFRDNKVAGFFSQIGQLYVVHHIWNYADLQSRKDVRENAWRKPGWDECVAYTVPLIREMRARWMVANTFSPIQ